MEFTPEPPSTAAFSCGCGALVSLSSAFSGERGAYSERGFRQDFSMPGCRYRPTGALGALVECLWYWEGAPGPHLQERLLPQAQAAMILNLREEPIAIYEDNGAAQSYGQPFFPARAR